jgi:hypothetical protein
MCERKIDLKEQLYIKLMIELAMIAPSELHLSKATAQTT